MTMGRIRAQLPKLKSQSGQVAIFIALVFQVLFVFFAMVINVGLLVHQKINLQNSVDLAAYYGAMKQAENLNAIAHINYQIRQSWKLLMFRYQQIGSAGDDTLHPYRYAPADQARFISESDSEEYQRANVFCSSYAPISPYTNNQDYCRNLPSEISNPTSLLLPGKSSFNAGSGFFNFDRIIINISTMLTNQVLSQCRVLSGANWFAMARFLAAYKMDLANRKKSIFLVAKGMSKTTNDFLDLDGESVKDGIEKTIKKNLTPENRDNFKSEDLKLYNSMADGGCGSSGDEPPKWLVETNIFPTFYYIDRECDNPGEIKATLKIINDNHAASAPKYPQGFEAAISNLENYIYEPQSNAGAAGLYKSALGFEKNPWCMTYVKVQAQTTPNIPFSPLGKITLKATAFAKPFGGKIGPWYGTTWPKNQPGSPSDPVKRIDERVPERVGPGEFPDTSGANRAINLQPNYSRYVGDKFGTRSKLTTGQFGKAIHSMGPISYAWWDHLVSEDLESASSHGDLLAWDSISDKAPPMRNLEIAALAPDHFDLNYYSVEPDYYRNYLVRLEKRKDKGSLVFRGDLGFRRNAPDAQLLKYSVKDQIAMVSDSTKVPVDTTGKLKYVVLKFVHLLNSWQGKDPEDYGIDDSRFGKCEAEGIIKDELPPEKATPGNCMVGGRVGYSVKLVDEDYLRRDDLELGGAGQRAGIFNKPPQ